MTEVKYPDGLEFRSDISVVLIDSMGSDLRIVNAARASLGHEHLEFEYPADERLINTLIKEEHGAPFEKVRFEFMIECPVFIARQWFKHRFSSFSEVSGRYSDYKPAFWIPEDENVRRQVGRRMSYQYEKHPDDEVRERFINSQKYLAEYSYNLYNDALSEGVARELARLGIGMNVYTRFMWGVDLRNLTNFLVLRNDDHAQLEIHEAAQQVEKAFEMVCPVTYRLWNENGRRRLAGID